MGLFDFLKKGHKPKPPTEPVVCNSFAPEINWRHSDGQLTWTLRTDLPVGTQFWVSAWRAYEHESEDKAWMLYQKAHLVQNEGVNPSGQFNLLASDETALAEFTEDYVYPADKHISDEVIVSFGVWGFKNRDLFGDENHLLNGDMVEADDHGKVIKVKMDADYPLNPGIRQQAEDYVDYFRDQVAQRAIKTEDCIVIEDSPGDSDVWDLAKKSLIVRHGSDGAYSIDVTIKALESKFCQDSMAPHYYIEGLPVPFPSLNSLEDSFELFQEYGWKDGEGEPGKGIFRVYDGIHDGVDNNYLKLTRDGDLVHMHWQAETYLNIYATFAVDWR